MTKVLFSLSNPPSIKEFATTRHNVGRIFLDWLVKTKYPRANKTVTKKYIQFQIQQTNKQKIVFCGSEQYMNLSGKALEAFIAKNRSLFLKETITTRHQGQQQKNELSKSSKSLKNIVKEHFLFIHDDLEHKFGNVRIKQKGSAEGHNGIKSIIQKAGGNDFKRLQIGIDRPKSNDPQIVARYVLESFSKTKYSRRLINFYRKKNISFEPEETKKVILLFQNISKYKKLLQIKVIYSKIIQQTFGTNSFLFNFFHIFVQDVLFFLYLFAIINSLNNLGFSVIFQSFFSPH